MATTEPGGRETAPEGLRRVQALLNSVNVEFGPDRLATRDGLLRWLERHHPDVDTSTVGEAGRVHLVGVREALRSLLRVNAGVLPPDDPALTEAAAVLESVPLRLSVVGGEPALAGPGAGVELVAGRVLVEVNRAQREGTWARLKICHDGRCQWVYYDRSRNGSGRWCSMAVCGTRSKMARYRG